jgi:hypothetical protein
MFSPYISPARTRPLFFVDLWTTENILTVESFEVAPKTGTSRTLKESSVLYTLCWPAFRPLDSKSHESLAQFIVYHERDAIADTKADKSTAQQNTQDTSSPRFITELLTGIIRGFSTKPAETQKETVFVSKRIDNHVLCGQDSEAPWRRSPIWLVIRVALQTTMHERQTNERRWL